MSDTVNAVRDQMQTATNEIKNMINSQSEKMSEFEQRIERVEVKNNRIPFHAEHKVGPIIEQLEKSDSFTSFKNGNLDRCRVEMKSLIERKALTGADNIVFPDNDPNIYNPVQRPLRLMDLMPSVPTDSNTVQFTRETSAPDNAGEQSTEGTAKNESTVSFEEASATVATIAHYLTVSKQALDDRAALQEYIDRRMTYQLMLDVEEKLIHGTGDLKGLDQTGNFTQFDGPLGDHRIDTILYAQAQLEASDNVPTGLLVHPNDWRAIRELKDNDGNYLHGFPNANVDQRLWGVDVVVTPSIAEGEFILADFQRGAMTRDRQNASIEMSRHHNDNFTKNLVTILAEVRLALTVVRPSAILWGDFESIS